MLKKLLPIAVLVTLLSVIASMPSATWAQETNQDYYTIKYDGNGNVLWSRACDSGFSGYAYKVAVDGEGNIIVTGRSETWHDYDTDGERDEEELNFDYYTVKYDHTGVEQWQRTYDGGAMDEALCVAVDSTDNVIVTGRSFTGTDYDICTLKYDPEGREIWSQPLLYNGGGSDGANGVAVDSLNDIIVAGYSEAETMDYCIIKYEPGGSIVEGWPIFYDSGFKDSAFEVAIDSNNNIVVTGVVGVWRDFDDDGERDEGELTSDVCTLKYDKGGVEVWVEPILHNIGPSGSNDTPFGLAIDNDGNIIVTGSYSIREEAQSPQQFTLREWQLYNTIKYDSNGDLVDGWPVIYDGGSVEHVYDVAVDLRDNSIIVTGEVSDGKSWNYHTIKYDSTGVEQWHQTHDGGEADVAYSVAVDGEGNIIVTGSSLLSPESPGPQDENNQKEIPSSPSEEPQPEGLSGAKITIIVVGSLVVIGLLILFFVGERRIKG
ncbi:hypothetical protein ACFLX4_00425 [Chloroflexota bacterium]